MDVSLTLDLVAHKGGPAQQAAARRLIDQLSSDPDDSDALEAAQQLVDAYFNDPHLERR